MASSYLSQPQNCNRYVYTSNNPTNRHDPDGQRWFYKCERGNGGGVQWVNPNDDGSYTSPGEGWKEFIPRSRYDYLTIYTNDGRQAIMFGEGADGSPRVVGPLWTGKVEDATLEIAMTLAGGIGIKALAKGALGLWAKHQAKREAFELAVQALSKKNPNQIAKGVSDV